MSSPIQQPTSGEEDAAGHVNGAGQYPAGPEPAAEDDTADPQIGLASPTRELPSEPAQTVHTIEPEQRFAATPTAGRPYGAVVADLGVDRETVVNREKERYGGIKIGSAFFGWLAAAGMAVILTSLLTAAGVVLSLTSKTSTTDITNQAAAGTGAAKTVGLVGAILLLVVLFVAYYCGGYVAARMARFNGVKQGLAVWLWSIAFAIIIFILAQIGGSKYNILNNLNLPRIPVDEGSLTTATIIAIAAIVVVTLAAALLGGLAGMRFHRNVDKAGLAV